MIRINDIIEKAADYLPATDQELIQKAYVFSAAAHAGQIRLSGEPYLSHPLEVSNILAEIHLDGPTIAAGLLHDTVEDTHATIEDLARQFGDDVALIVNGVTKIGKMHFDSKEEAQAENIRKMIIAMAEDIRVIMVKLADRLHNMSTLEFQKEIKQKSIAKETLDIYAPLANRLGLYKVKVKLEDLALRFGHPDAYFQIKEGVGRMHQAGQDYIDRVCVILHNVLQKNDVKAKVYGRIKHLYSIYHKMKIQNLSLDQVYDQIAFRVLVDSAKDCYTVLGLAHSEWKPVPGKFKDYISMPKANMYQSLHTTVIGPGGERIEIQIRTHEMHRLAEYGVAAHWLYKEGGKMSGRDADTFSWLRSIMDWQGESKDPREFMSSLRFDLFQDEVYVFTPRGEVKELPDSATPVDFAYMIHSEVGDHCSGAKVNGRLVPLNTKLKNGDRIEILTNAEHHPSRDWLQFVKTAKARTRIKHWIRTKERDRSIALAKEMLEKAGRKVGVNIQKAIKKGDLARVSQDMSFKSLDDLLSAVGYAQVTPRQVLSNLIPKEDPAVAKAAKKAPESEREKESESETKPKSAVKLRGIDNVLVRFAQCCTPLPGDPIVGYISRGRGVTVHTQDCPNVANMEEERLLEVSWESDAQKSFPAKIMMICDNATGVLAQVAGVLAEEKVNIDSGNFRSDIDGRSELEFMVEVIDTSHLYRTIERLRAVEHVREVLRLTTG